MSTPRPARPSIPTNFRIEASLRQTLAEVSERTGRRQGEIVEAALRAYLKAPDPDAPAPEPEPLHCAVDWCTYTTPPDQTEGWIRSTDDLGPNVRWSHVDLCPVHAAQVFAFLRSGKVGQLHIVETIEVPISPTQFTITIPEPS